MDPLPKDVVGKIAAAEKLKTEGNEHFKAQAWKKAIGCYQRVGLFITGPPFGGAGGGGVASMFGGQAPGGAAAQEKLTDEQEEQVAGLTLSMNLNLSACYIKEEKWEKASDRAGKVLEKHPENAKALFRRGHACIFLNKFEGARVDLEAALAISPDDKAIPSKLALLAKKEKQYEQKEKKVFAKMFAPSKDAAPSSKEHGHAHGGAAVAHGHAHDSDDACCAEGHGHVHVGELEPEHSHGHGHGHGSETQATASDARQDRADRLGASPMVTEEPTAAGAAPQQESAESMHKSTYKW